MSDLKIWIIIISLAVGTYLIRWSFLGALGNKELPVPITRMLRYTPVAVLPALVAPLVVWPAATGGAPDPARMAAAVVTVTLGLVSKNVLLSIFGGVATLAMLLYLL